MKIQWEGSENPKVLGGFATFTFDNDEEILINLSSFKEFSEVCKALKLAKDEQEDRLLKTIKSSLSDIADKL